MAFSERYGVGLGTTLRIQLRSISNITTATVTNVTLRSTGQEPTRNGRVLFTIDSEDYQVDFELSDETFHARTITGAVKNLKDPAAAARL